jgi:hypothetical protein
LFLRRRFLGRGVPGRFPTRLAASGGVWKRSWPARAGAAIGPEIGQMAPGVFRQGAYAGGSMSFVASPMPTLDSPLLLTTLRDELRAAWHAFRALPGHERLYGFGVYTTDSASYLTATAFSETGLDTVAAKYRAGKFGRGRDPALLRESLRWSPADSPLHAEGLELLSRSDAIVQELDFEGRGDDDGDDDGNDDDLEADDERDPDVQEVFRVAAQALRELDAEGLFGSGDDRERLVLCIWEGDQSNEERYRHARSLNPPSVARRFGEEMNAGLRAYYRAYMPEEEAPEDDVFE